MMLSSYLQGNVNVLWTTGTLRSVSQEMGKLAFWQTWPGVVGFVSIEGMHIQNVLYRTD